MVSMKTKALISTSLGIAFEWYDFFLYSLLAPVIAQLFFPKTMPILALAYAYVVLFIGFVGRPLGGLIFGHIGDKFGRIRALYFTLLIAGISVLLVGIMPTYAQIGIAAPILLAILRLVDGIGLGGEWGGSFSLTSEYISPNLRGFYSGLLQATVPIASLLISGFTLLFTSVLGESGFYAVGWRFIFIIGFLVSIIGVFIRFRVADSPVFQKLMETGKVVKSPISEAFRKYWKLILMGLFLVGIINGAYYYINFAFALGYATTIAKSFHMPYVPYSVVSESVLVSSPILIILALVIGYLSDRVGRRPLILANAIGAIIFIAPYLFMLLSGNPTLVMTAIVLGGLILWELAGAITPIVLVEMFPPEVRYTGISAAYQIGVGFIGGLSPYILTFMIAALHNIFWPPLIYTVVWGIVILFIGIVLGETKGRLYTGEEILKQS